jgi:hypothetical protein
LTFPHRQRYPLPINLFLRGATQWVRGKAAISRLFLIGVAIIFGLSEVSKLAERHCIRLALLCRRIKRGMMRIALAWLSFIASTVSVHANSCSNVHMVGSRGKYYFQDNIARSSGYLNASGVFLRPNEADESKQSDFNLSSVTCEKQGQLNDSGAVAQSQITCEVHRSYVYPSTSTKGTCFLDFESESFQMQEVNAGRVLTGAPFFNGISCYQKTLAINRDTKQVTLTYTKITREDCTKTEEGLGFKYQDAFSEVLQECPKDRQY